MSDKKIPIRYVKDTKAIKSSIVLPPDTNNHHTMFGGKVMAYIDDLAAISAMRHARSPVVTASIDSIDFLHPILEGHSVCLESFVTWTSKTSMEVFVKVVGEDLMTGDRAICATSFLTFVALDDNGTPKNVEKIIPQSEEEIRLHDSAPKRAERRRIRREESKRIAGEMGHIKPWE
jgi:acyl-CoA hydrolase